MGAPASRQESDEPRSGCCDILVVDDDSSCLEAMHVVLEGEGYRVGTASSCAHAMTLLARAESIPRLILLDLMMPDVSGDKLVAELRKSPALAAISVVLLSGLADLPRRAKALGVDGYLAKPPSADELFEVSRRFAGEPSAPA